LKNCDSKKKILKIKS